MANEFIARKGLIALEDSQITGSLSISQNLNVIGGLTASFDSSTSTAISGAFTSVSSSIASERLKNTTDTLTGDLTVTGTITAQDLHVQEVTSSIVYSSGSNIFGSLNSHSHDFTGTINISRGGDRKVSFTDTRGGKVWTIEHDPNQIYLWNSTDSEAPIMFKNSGNVIMNAGSVGIGTDSTNAPLAVVGTGAGSIGTINIKGSNAHLGFTSGSGTFRSWVGHFDTVGHGSEADLNIKTGYGTTGNIRFTADGDTTAAQIYLQGSSGHLGIGTTDPGSRRLSVHKNTAITAGFNDIAEFLDTTLGVGGSVSLNVGRENATRNLGKMAFYYAGDNSISNALNFGFYDADNLMTILANGNVGIGTTSPGRPLHIDHNGALSAAIQVGDITTIGSNTGIYFRTTGNAYISTASTGTHIFDKAGTERMRIQADGKVGIGTTSPAGDLEISGSGNSNRTITFNPVFNDDISISSMGVDASGWNALTIGQANSTNNSGVIRFKYAGAGSTSNYIGLGFYSNDDLLKIQADGKVTITGDTNSTAHLKFATVAGGSTNSYIGNFAGDLYLSTNYYYDGGHNSDNASRRSMEYFMSDDVVQISTMPAGNPGTRTQVMFISGSQGYVGIGTNTPSTTLTVGHASHGVGAAYMGGSSLPSIAGIFTDNGTNGGNGFGDLFIKARTDYAPFYNILFQTAAVANTPVTRMIIQDDGNIGIGTTSPGYPLHISSTSVYQAAIKSTGAQYLLLGSEDANGAGIIFDGDSNGDGAGGDYSYIVHESSGILNITQDSPSGVNHIRFGTAGVENKVVINENGNLGIGNTSPDSLLQIGESYQTTAGTNKRILINIGGYYSTADGLQYQVLGFTGTTFDESDIFTQSSGEKSKNFYLGLVSDSGYFNADRFSVIGGGSEIMTFKPDSKYVGIGTTSPSVKLEVNGNVQTGQSLNVSSYSHVGQTNSGAMTIFAHNARVDTSNNNRVTTTNTGYPSSWIKMYYTQGISFHTTPSTMTAGDIVLDGPGANTYERARVTSDGLTFNGDTAAANALDDYEEGTWTPVLTASSSAPTVGYDYRSGDYTKIGNIVFCRFGFKVNSISGGSGTVRVSGLPYTHTNQGGYQEPNISVQSGALSTADYAYRTRMFVANSSTYIEGRIANNSDTAWNISEITSTSWIIAEFFYHVN